MIVEKILKQLTPERIKKEIEAIQKVKLPEELQKWVKEYEKVGGRDEFIWKWFFKINQEITLLGIKKEYQASLEKSRFLITILIVSIDDIFDTLQNKELLNITKYFFNSSNQIKSARLNTKEKQYIKLIIKTWKHIQKSITTFPKYKNYKDLFEFYILQALNSMHYDYLVNHNHYLINRKRAWQYSTYSMPVMIDIILNLMCASRFNTKEFSLLMEIGVNAQKMARIGNWVSTWEREVKDNDFSSGVFAYALGSGIIRLQDLKKQNKNKIIKKIKQAQIENTLILEWEKCYQRIFNLKNKIKIINIGKFLITLENLFMLELISKNYK